MDGGSEAKDLRAHSVSVQSNVVATPPPTCIQSFFFWGGGMTPVKPRSAATALAFKQARVIICFCIGRFLIAVIGIL